MATSTNPACDISPGDLIRTGTAQSTPFQVMAIHGDKAWVRSLADGSGHLALTERCRKLNSAAFAFAAE